MTVLPTWDWQKAFDPGFGTVMTPSPHKPKKGLFL
jgi:hypothetical protein